MHESEKWKWNRSIVSNSLRPHGLQPTRLLRPWDFLGKSTGVGCHRLLRSRSVGRRFTIWAYKRAVEASTVQWKQTCISMQVHQQQTKQPQNSGKNKPIVYISFFYYYFRIIIWNLLLKVEKVSIFYATIILAALYSLRWAQVSGGNAYVNINCSNVCIGGKM